MPFSKFNGAFTLDHNQFRVKILSGDGSIKGASMAQMFKSEIGDRNFLDKDVKNGKVFFSLNDIKSGRYLLEVYVSLSNGVVGTFARGFCQHKVRPYFIVIERIDSFLQIMVDFSFSVCFILLILRIARTFLFHQPCAPSPPRLLFG